MQKISLPFLQSASAGEGAARTATTVLSSSGVYKRFYQTEVEITCGICNIRSQKEHNELKDACYDIKQ
ncbi:hypothetical protein R1flu_025904 [Riccia fluitans]|uniref:Uncharacterized protein n=1 Tax=Riccia fluitans TaxID=41844 RepID=A0ABD1XZ21_9MARC